MRTLLLSVAVVSVVIAIVTRVGSYVAYREHLIHEIAKLNGTIDKGLEGVYFSVGGLQPIATDKDIVRLLPLMKRYRSIDFVSLSNCAIGDASLCGIAEELGDRLVELELDGTEVTAGGLRCLSGCEHLWILVIPSRALTDEGIDALAEIPELHHLLVSGEPDDSEMMTRARTRMPSVGIASHDRFSF